MNGRYVRVARSDNLPEFINIAEIYVYGPENGVEKQRTITGASSSSTYLNFPASNVYNNLTTDFVHTNADTWGWIEVDLGREVPISKVQVYNRSDSQQRIIGCRLEIYNASKILIWTRDFPAVGRVYYEFLIRP